MQNCSRMFQKVLNLSSIVFGLFYTVEVVFLVQVEFGCSAGLKLFLSGKKCVVAKVVLGCVVLVVLI